MADVEANILSRTVDRVTAPIRRVNVAVDRLTERVHRARESVHRLGEAAGLDTLAGGLRDAGGVAAAGLMGRLSGMFSPLTALGDALSVSGLANAVSAYATAAAEVGAFAGQVGIGVEALQELNYAAAQQGIAQDTFRDGLATFARTLGEVETGSGALHDQLTQMNPAFAEMLAGAGSTEEAFLVVMRAMGSLEDETQRAALGTAAFGEAGLQMAQLGAVGSDGIAALREEAQRLGLVLSEQDMATATSFQESLSTLQSVLDGLRNTIGRELLPQILPVVAAFTAWLAANREVIAQNIAGAIQKIADAVRAIDWEAVITGIQGFLGGIQPVIDAVGGWEAALIALFAVMNGDLIGAVLKVGGAFLSLGRILLTNPILAIVAAIAGAALLIYQNWDGIMAWLKPLLSDLGDFASDICEIFESVVQKVTGILPDWLKEKLGIEVEARPLSNEEILEEVGHRGREAADGVPHPGWLASQEKRAEYEFQRELAYKEASQDAQAEMPAENVRILAAQSHSPTLPPTQPENIRSGSAAPGDTRSITDPIRQTVRDITIPANAYMTVRGPAIEAPRTAFLGARLSVPTISTVTDSAIDLPAPPVSAGSDAGSGAAASILGGEGGVAASPFVPVSVSVTVNGQVEADAIRRAVEDAVRRALVDARLAEAADARASFYD